jgi:hypothetical protein
MAEQGQGLVDARLPGNGCGGGNGKGQRGGQQKGENYKESAHKSWNLFSVKR